MDETQIKLGLYFTAINLASILISTLVLIELGLIEGLATFIVTVTTLTYIVQTRIEEKFSEKPEQLS